MKIVAIDGPAGAGKSTVARALAHRMGVQYLDTGAMYRAVTWLALRSGCDLSDDQAVGEVAERCVLHVGLDDVVVDGHDVTQEIRQSEVTKAVSIVAANPRVRTEMRRRQRQWGEARGGGVIEGRDIGTVVFPDAIAKLFLTANPRVRAERRVAEVGGDVDEIEAQIVERDRLDSTRSDSPLAESSDAIVIDTSDKSVGEVVDELVRLVEERS
ncbi:MAG: (d)CMP kinase [Actinomycetota bacterium]|nr:(d)CMP kinase [Actinomycetota bacterium]MDA3011186.1 (d)CMP kinase [Actinomycetota bacterium]MDA3023889.1 (d)CMP kinase [Actinomycetota bacterium]